ncbi:MAG: ABC transporter permease subunit, partial [Desulfurococcaceae archaeon]
MSRARSLKDKLFVFAVAAGFRLAVAPLFHLAVVVFERGIPALVESGLGFFTDGPPSPLSTEVGGIAPAISGSLILLALSLPIVVLIALFASLLTLEFPGNPVSKAVDVAARSFASVPTIVVSMAVYSLVVVPAGRFSALAGAVALVMVSLPYAYTSFSTALRSIPSTYREAAYFIAMKRWTALIRVVIP